ncbi:MAG: alpha-N-arabinofuranosidase [Alistipes sp.]|nr:alpha-N-arabinofuranosidase [Alistipes sp.]
MKRLFALLATLCCAVAVTAQPVEVHIQDRATNQPTIAPEIYGQFSEHLGTCIYGGLWVGEDSEIPNEDGYRTDVLEALKALKVPVLRWPGGCFADEYHWRDGIGPKENRPRMVNSNWGGTIEDNSFGTHEFLNLCEKLGCEPYISGNVGSGSVEELAKWVEYMTADNGPMAEERKRNGREKPWRVKYLGVGNESWGCGGSMRPEYYSDLYRRYATYCRNFNDNRLYKIASGASDYDFNWTEVLLKQIGHRMHGLSLHYYTVKGWQGSKGSATNFSIDEYYETLGKALEIEPVIRRHIALMDAADPQKRIGLLVDEWGTWFDEEPGTVRGHLYQQNTMRDAMVAALTFNVFHRYADRITMANIAQIANVLQAMVLTRGDEMVLTPTYHAFWLYRPHQGATFIPTTCSASERQVTKTRSVPEVSVTASRDKTGKIHLSIVNPELEKEQTLLIAFDALQPKSVSGEMLHADSIDAYNDFGVAPRVGVKPFKGAKITKAGIELKLPAASILTLEIE